MNANTSWNLAIVTLGACLAAFLASVIASASGWHTVTTGRAAVACAVAMVACGVWLHLAAGRFCSQVGRRGEDERAERPYGRHHDREGGAP